MGSAIFGVVDHHEPTTTEARRRLIHNCQGKGRRHRSVHGVAAAFEHFHSRNGGEIAIGNDQTRRGALRPSGFWSMANTEEENEDYENLRSGRGTHVVCVFNGLNYEMQLKLPRVQYNVPISNAKLKLLTRSTDSG
jgi:hypothetical protein